MDEHRLRYRGWRVVAGCGAGAFFATAPLYTFGVFLKPLSDDFGWPRESAASAYGTLTLVAAAAAPCLGGLLDRFGPRRVIVPCLVLSGCAVASLSMLTPSLWHLRAIFAVLGLATMGASPIAYSRVIFSWFDIRRGRALGLMLAGAALSGIVLPPAVQALIGLFGWRGAWLALGGSTLAIAVPTAIRFIRDREAPRAAATAGVPGVAVGQALRSRVFWTLAIVVFGGTMAINGAIVHMVALLADRGVPPDSAALAVSAMGGASLAGRILTGWLLDRFAAARVSMLLLATAALGTFLLAGAHSIGAALVAATCIGFGSGGEADVTPYLLSRHFGLRSFSTLFGLSWTAWGLAGVAAPALMGRGFDLTGSYTTSLIELGLVALVSGGLMMTLPAVPSSAAQNAVEQQA